ncbi:TPA: DNA mismatch repair endonuclease MutL [Candidatus Poribacteria bacterium]|nr:DNA mismatch repair endonuclease MutL [Candidatus Poribacteria bacterium]HEX28773.1 DNA mismatch repair endonuclease MutL [Candidatus Poribacteria bacterium]
MRIRVLPEEIANKIAAGEVVERPASVVKELMENSIDAESRSIEVEVLSGGKKLIQVADDGIGMSREDALLSIRRHATSKISSAEDLAAIKTLGFRGEALPSIASVSKMELVTRTAGDLSGTKIVVEGGRVKEVGQIGCPVGTRVRVSNLFFNLPARAKFLKSESSEFRHILNIFTWNALAHPDILFRLTHNRRKVMDLPPSETIAERIYAIYGKSFSENLIEIHEELPNMAFHAFVGNPSFTKPNRSYQLFFLNGRPIRSRLIAAALDEALRAVIPRERHAVAFIFIEMNPRHVDVNVHPTKMEVRFSDERAVYSQIVRILNKGIHSGLYVPGSTSQAMSEERMERESGEIDLPNVAQEEIPLAPHIRASVEDQRIDLKLGGLKFDQLAIRGVLFDTYILAESGDEVVIIDQHAASERIIYERLISQFEGGGIAIQGLLMPITIDLPANLIEAFLENVELLSRLGFDLERFGGNTLLVRGVPSSLENSEIEGALVEILERIRTGLGKVSRTEMIREMLVILACRSAIKAGDKLSQEEIERLLSDLSRTELPFNCPHSRPTIIRLSRKELESRFRRR